MATSKLLMTRLPWSWGANRRRPPHAGGTLVFEGAAPGLHGRHHDDERHAHGDNLQAVHEIDGAHVERKLHERRIGEDERHGRDGADGIRRAPDAREVGERQRQRTQIADAESVDDLHDDQRVHRLGPPVFARRAVRASRRRRRRRRRRRGMMAFSAGAKARVRPTELTTSSRRICRGVIGSVTPWSTAALMAKDLPPHPGNVKTVAFFRLSPASPTPTSKD
ncbi:MAG: hypothetical protein ACLFU0_00805 [Alphaproteobacteria bacterium]